MTQTYYRKRDGAEVRVAYDAILDIYTVTGREGTVRLRPDDFSRDYTGEPPEAPALRPIVRPGRRS